MYMKRNNKDDPPFLNAKSSFPQDFLEFGPPTSWVTMPLLGMTSFHGALGGTLGPPLH